MRVMWVHRASGNDEGGDAIYDRRMTQSLGAHIEIEPFAATRRGRGARLASMATRLQPPDQVGYGTEDELAEARRRLSDGFDAVVVSHENLDDFARRLAPSARAMGAPVISIRHNLTSDMMASILGEDRMISSLALKIWRAQETRALSGDVFDGVVVLSNRDRDLLAERGWTGETAVAMPGAPPAVALAPDAEIRQEILLTGTYDWFPKAMSLRRLRDEVVADTGPALDFIVDEGVPDDIAAQLRAKPLSGIDLSGAVRFGLIADRFTAGHKLKTSAYLQSNAIVLSFAKVSHDFTFSDAAMSCIYEVSSLDDIRLAMAEASEQGAEAARTKLAAAKTHVAEELDWDRQASRILDLLRRARAVGAGAAFDRSADETGPNLPFTGRG
ncbi:MAG: hypothetical protein AAFX03_09005 [Pseudomonadota bacterium]